MDNDLDMTDDIAVLRRTIAEIHASKELDKKSKRELLEVYEAMLETAEAVQGLDETANCTIATCRKLDRICAKILRTP